MIKFRRALPLLVSIPLLLAGCAPRIEVAPHQMPEEPIKLSDGVWQQAWVDPAVVYSDSLFTLIRAARIDSFLVPPGKLQPELPDIAIPGQPRAQAAGALKFRIPAGGCQVSVTLVGDQIIVQPVQGKPLAPGYYKLTCDLSGINPAEMPQGAYRLAVDFCGQTRSGTIQK